MSEPSYQNTVEILSDNNGESSSNHEVITTNGKVKDHEKAATPAATSSVKPATEIISASTETHLNNNNNQNNSISKSNDINENLNQNLSNNQNLPNTNNENNIINNNTDQVYDIPVGE